jgi:hypothetical protein
MGFRNAGIRAALVLGLAMAIALAVAASLALQPDQVPGAQAYSASSFLTAPTPPAIEQGSKL